MQTLAGSCTRASAITYRLQWFFSWTIRGVDSSKDRSGVCNPQIRKLRTRQIPPRGPNTTCYFDDWLFSQPPSAILDQHDDIRSTASPHEHVLLCVRVSLHKISISVVLTQEFDSADPN